jgi:hypothetical protein
VEKEEVVDGVRCGVIASGLGDRKVTNREHVGVKEDGIYRLKAEGITLQPAVLFFKLPVAKQSWKVNSKSNEIVISGNFEMSEAEVEVPAGKFKTIKVAADLKIDGRSMRSVQYFAKGVGFVKQELFQGERKTVIELEKLELGE